MFLHSLCSCFLVSSAYKLRCQSLYSFSLHDQKITSSSSIPAQLLSSGGKTKICQLVIKLVLVGGGLGSLSQNWLISLLTCTIIANNLNWWERENFDKQKKHISSRYLAGSFWLIGSGLQVQGRICLKLVISF